MIKYCRADQPGSRLLKPGVVFVNIRPSVCFSLPIPPQPLCGLLHGAARVFCAGLPVGSAQGALTLDSKVEAVALA